MIWCARCVYCVEEEVTWNAFHIFINITGNHQQCRYIITIWCIHISKGTLYFTNVFNATTPLICTFSHFAFPMQRISWHYIYWRNINSYWSVKIVYYPSGEEYVKPFLKVLHLYWSRPAHFLLMAHHGYCEPCGPSPNCAGSRSSLEPQTYSVHNPLTCGYALALTNLITCCLAGHCLQATIRRRKSNHTLPALCQIVSLSLEDYG